MLQHDKNEDLGLSAAAPGVPRERCMCCLPVQGKLDFFLMCSELWAYSSIEVVQH